MKYLEFADKHPVAAPVLLALLLVAALLALTILVAAQMPKMSEEEARARPKMFAFLVVSKKLAPVLTGLAKPLFGVFAAAIAEQLVNEHFTSETPTSRPSPLPSGEEPRS